ncbi:hypothetical protein [Agrobacterium sp. T29]|uniref:hypothetical protein n=1 Tax=Agrobacterium sp. T29 TaxID=2580515 RepID=UPI00115E11FC|nr:hypothetical protein [Agrobacterium sp. T29]
MTDDVQIELGREYIVTRAAYESQNYVNRNSHEDAFWKAIEHSSSDKKAGILFHGDGGSGKTWLFEHLKSEIFTKIRDQSKSAEPGFNFTYLSLDRGNDRLLDWFLSLRMNAIFNLGHQPKLTSHFRYFKRFDALLMNICRIEGKDYSHPKYKGLFSRQEYVDAVEGGLLDNLTSLLDLAKDGAFSVVEASPISPLVKIFSDLVGKTINWASLKSFEQDFAGVKSWGIDDCLEKLPGFLAADLNDLAMDFPQNKTVVFVDGHDRLFSGASADQGTGLELNVRKFCDALSMGTVVLFSQYKVGWFSAHGEAADKPNVALSEGFLLGGNSSFDELGIVRSGFANLSLSGEASTSLSVAQLQIGFDGVSNQEHHPFDSATYLPLRGFETTEQMLQLVSNLGLGHYAKTPAMEAILRHTALPFELRAKLEHLQKNGAHKSGDQKFYEQPFESIFADIMVRKPHNEARLLKLIWFLSEFDRALLAKVCSVLGISDENLMDRMLGTGMFRDVETAPGRLVVEHHYQRLLAKLVAEEWREKARKSGRTYEEYRGDDRALLADALMLDLANRRKSEPLHQLSSAVNDLMNCLGTSLATDGSPLSKMSDPRRLSELLNVHLDFIEDMMRVEPPGESLGALDFLARWARQRIERSLDTRRSDVSEFVLLACRADEMMAQAYCTPGSSYDPGRAHSILMASRAVLDRLAETRFFVPISPSLLSYWIKRIDLVTHRLSPKWSGAGVVNRGRVASYGPSLSLTMRGLVVLRELLRVSASDIDQLEARHHRLFLAKTLYAAGIQLRRADVTKAKELLAECQKYLSDLASHYPSDLSVIEELIEADPDIDDAGLPQKSYIDTINALARYVEGGHSGGRLLYWLEKANIRLARSYIGEGNEFEGLPATADEVLKRNYQCLAEQVASRSDSHFSASQLLIKSLRKTIQIYQRFPQRFSTEEFGVDVNFIGDVIKGAYQVIENTGISLRHPILHESAALAELSEPVAKRFVAAAAQMAQSAKDNVGRAFWLIVVADLTAQWAKHDRETIDVAPSYLAAVRAIDACVDIGHENEAVFSERRRAFVARLFSIKIRDAENTGVFFGDRDEIIDLKGVLSTSDINRILNVSSKISEINPNESSQILEVYLPVLFDLTPLDLSIYAQGMQRYLSLSGRSSAFGTGLDELTQLKEDFETHPEGLSGYSAIFSANKLQQSAEQEAWDRSTRILAAALIGLDPILPADNVLRQSLRRRYAEAVWHALEAHRASRRNLIVNRSVSHTENIDDFVNGSTERFGVDLVSLLLRFRAPPRPMAGDLLASELVQATRANVGFGSSVAAPVCFGKWGEHEISLAPNLISALEFHSLNSIRQNRDGEISGEDSNPTATERPSELLTISEAFCAEREQIREPMRLVMSLLKPRNGRFAVSQRGWEHVKAVLDLLYPGVVGNGELGARIAMGASNSWLLAFVPREHKSILLNQGGWFVKSLEKVLGLRRVTLSETSHLIGHQAREKEIREFTNDAFKALKLIELTGGIAHFLTDLSNTDPRKVRTFSSMFKKLFPGVQPRVSGPDELWTALDPSNEDARNFEINLGKGFVAFHADEFDPNKEYTLVVQQLTPRGATLGGEDDERILLPLEVIQRSGLIVVPQQTLICRVSREGGRYEARSAAILHVDDSELEEFTVIDVDRPTRRFRAEAPADTRQLDINNFATAGGNLLLAQTAGHNDLKIGDVLLCEVKYGPDGEPTITYVKTRDKSYNLLTRHHLTVRNFSMKHNAYFLEGENLSGFIKLPKQMLFRAGYRRLYEGDVIAGSVFSNRKYPLVSRVLNCSRRLFRDVEVIVGAVQETAKGRRWRLEVVRPKELECEVLPVIYLHDDFLPEFWVSLHLPRGVRAFVDLQQEPERRFSVTRVVDVPQFEGGRWVLGEITVSKSGRWLLVFETSGGTEVSLIPQELYGKLAPVESRANVWALAKLAKTQSGWVVCGIRSVSRTKTPLEKAVLADNAKLASLNSSRDADWVAAELEDGTLARVSRNMLRLEDLPDRRNVGLPILCQVVMRRGIKTISYVKFDASRGFKDALCLLHPTRDGADGRVVEVQGSGKKAFISKGHRCFADIRDGEAGKYYSVSGYVSEGKHLIIKMKPEYKRIPWVYGFYLETRNVAGGDGRGKPSRHHVFRALGDTKEFSFPIWMLQQRGFQRFGLGERVRFTYITGGTGNVTPGMFEVPNEAAEWLHDGFVEWYNENKDFGKIAVLADPTAELRFSRAAFGEQRDVEIYKSMPVKFEFERYSGRNFKTLNVSRRQIRDLPWIEAEIKMIAPDDSYGFATIFTEEGGKKDAYIPGSICEFMRGGEMFEVGSQIFCQTLPNRKTDLIVVNAFLGLGWELADDERIVVAEQDSSHRKPGTFVDLFTGAHIRALSSAYVNDNEDDIRVRRDYIMYVGVREDGQNLVIDEIIDGLGVRFEYSPKPQDAESGTTSSNVSESNEITCT